jgi:hypothetical protein
MSGGCLRKPTANLPTQQSTDEVCAHQGVLWPHQNIESCESAGAKQAGSAIALGLPDEVEDEEPELDEELLLLSCLCFFLRAFLRASASALRFSSSSLGV